MSASLLMVLADARFPSIVPGHSGGIEAACSAGLVNDVTTLRAFLDTRLHTAGAVGAFAAAAVCERARPPHVSQSFWRTVEAELDARFPSPAARQASRAQGGNTLRMAMSVVESPVFDGLARATVSHGQQPHDAVALGAVAGVAGCGPEEAAEAAAYASIAGPAFAAQELLGIETEVLEQIGMDMSGVVSHLAREAANSSFLPLDRLPSLIAPALELLAQEHAQLSRKSYAS